MRYVVPRFSPFQGAANGAALRHLCNADEVMGHEASQRHDHASGPGHSNAHAPHHDRHDHAHGFDAAAQGRAFALAVMLNAVFVVAEVAAGLAGGSVALIADAGHNFGDVLALLLAWGASVLSRRPASAGFTYGLKSSSILAALANAALLWVALGAILVETAQRFADLQPVAGGLMIGVALGGIAVNALSALLFARGRKGDLNLSAAFQHLLADAAVSAGVVVAGVAVLLTGRAGIDPLASLLITLAIGWSSWGLLKDAARLALGAVPRGIDEHRVRGWLMTQPGVIAVHDLHIWAMSTTETALTAHLVMPGGAPGDEWLRDLAHALEARHRIHHATFQIEAGTLCTIPQGGHG